MSQEIAEVVMSCDVTKYVAASAGAIDGYKIECSMCGLTWTTSLGALAITEAIEHEHWHESRGTA